MARAKKVNDENESINRDSLINMLVGKLNENVGDGSYAYVLDNTDSPSYVKDWISTGSHLLDIAISNRPHGGLPIGRIVEFSGEEGSGKSLFCAHIAKNTQDKGGIVVYIDTEAACSTEFWKSFGLNPKYVMVKECSTIEEVFNYLEASIGYFRQINKNIPLTIIVDSIAGVSTEVELEGGYEKDGYGTEKSKILSKAMRKITQMISNQNVLVVFTNQVRQKLNAMPFSDPWVTPGGKAIPFHSSVRVRLKKIGNITDKNKNVIGTKCSARVIKNRMGPPLREVTEDLYFDSGINAYASWLDTLKKLSIIKQAGAYYKYTKNNGEEWQFQSKDFVSTLLSNEELKNELYDRLCDEMIMKYKTPETQIVEETENVSDAELDVEE